MVKWSNSSKDSCRAHAAAHAHCHHSITSIAALQLSQDGGRKFCPGATQRMAQRNCAAVYIDFIDVETQRLDDGERLRSESFVQLDDIYLIQRQTSQFQNFGNSKYRANSHFFRRAPGGCVSDE